MTVDTKKPKILYLKPNGVGGTFRCKSPSQTFNWSVNGATVAISSNNSLDGHDEVSVKYDVVLIFNKCVNNTEYGCNDDEDFHDSAIVYCKGLFPCNSFILCMCENITCVLDFLILFIAINYQIFIHKFSV